MEKTDIAKNTGSFTLPCFGKAAVDTKDIFTELLINTLTPLIYEGLLSIYTKAITYEKKYKENVELANPGIDVLFQYFLISLKKMNDTMIDDEVKRIRNKSQIPEFFDDLIRAVVKSNISLLTCAKKDPKFVKDKFHDTLNINLFIHKCYLESANTVFHNPGLFSYKNNKELVYTHIKTAIKNAIIQTLPMKDILSEYLNTDIEEIQKQYMENIQHMITDCLHKDSNVNLLEENYNSDEHQDDDYNLDLGEFLQTNPAQTNTNLLVPNNKTMPLPVPVASPEHNLDFPLNNTKPISPQPAEDVVNIFGKKGPKKLNDTALIMNAIDSINHRNNEKQNDQLNSNNVKLEHRNGLDGISITRKLNDKDENHFSE